MILSEDPLPSMDIQIARNGEAFGTFPEAQLQALVDQGFVLATDHYWREGMTEWLTVGSVWAPSSNGNTSPPLENRALSVLSVVAIVLGVAGLLASWQIVGGLAGIAAVVCGHLAIKRARATHNTTSHNLALGGTVLGYLSIAVSLVAIGTVFLAVKQYQKDDARAETALADMQAIATQLRLYERITGGLPASLDSLVKEPDPAVGVKGWKQLLEKVPVDPWGNQYYFFYLIDKGDFKLRSVGPDGIADTADDVVLK